MFGKLSLAIFASLLCGASFASEVYTAGFSALGTEITAQIKAEGQKEAQRCANIAAEETLRLEVLLSSYLEASEISRLGRSGGNWIEVSSDTAEVLLKAKEIASATEGAMDLTVGSLVKLWSVDQSYHKVPDKEEIAAALPLVNWQKIEVKTENGKHFASIGKGQEITVGAIGKGFIADKVADKIRTAGCSDALLSFGGNIITLGTNAKNQPWSLGIQEPDQKRGGYFAVVHSSDDSIVTSGNYEKYFIQDGVKYHHILNPKTGYPVPATLSSVTIIDKSSTFADGMCTALYVFGWDKAIRYLEARPEIAAVLVDDALKNVAVTENLRGKIRMTDSRFAVQYIGKKK